MDLRLYGGGGTNTPSTCEIDDLKGERVAGLTNQIDLVESRTVILLARPRQEGQEERLGGRA